MNKLIKICLFSLLIAVVSVSVCGSSFADSRNGYSGYPFNFDGNGIIDMYEGGNYISINDSSYEITEKTKFNRPGNLNCSKRWFKEKDFVYYILEPDTQKIKSLWLAKDKNLGRGTP